ncbi:hypothetical protein [Amycolatopsis sp. 195334CR]|uniref:hypothetical protein n=1 Tax=Amycolatopsis sp. 195334CR TaxID=2814588 RepID=UPI001A8D7A22|nr:hypothetical protein [Amycolatopsis sp. 195334CR]MBN6042029.1 hypothetical protein [Amycolatopsis sp. 195334CR]
MAARTLKALRDYGIDEHRGFLPAADPLDRLPPYFGPWEDAARDIGARLMTGRMREAVAALPELSPEGLTTDAERERAMLLLVCLANAHVWAADPPTSNVPAVLARPLHRLAAELDRPPIIAHASIVLANWRRLDPARPLGMDNIDTQVTFLGGVDEKWFYLATAGVELTGAPALKLLADGQEAVAGDDAARLTSCLTDLRLVLDRTIRAFLDVERWCDPYVFYHRVRRFLTGWDGVTLDGTGAAPCVLAGGSAAQSSLIQAFDTGLGIVHDDPLTAGFLGGMRRSMPKAHRRFLHDLGAGPSIRDYAGTAGHPPLTESYNAAVRTLTDLRGRHIGLTGRYITRFERGEGKGTGGSDFVSMLRRAREETGGAAVQDTTSASRPTWPVSEDQQ